MDILFPNGFAIRKFEGEEDQFGQANVNETHERTDHESVCPMGLREHSTKSVAAWHEHHP